jgi:hypothetical protein
VTSSDKVAESPTSGKSETPAGDPAGRRERDSLPGKDGPALPSNELDRGTNLDRPGVPLGSGGDGGGNMSVDTSIYDKLHSKYEEEHGKFGELRTPKAKP